MNILKKLFGIKKDNNSKSRINSLAEANEAPVTKTIKTENINPTKKDQQVALAKNDKNKNDNTVLTKSDNALSPNSKNEKKPNAQPIKSVVTQSSSVKQPVANEQKKATVAPKKSVVANKADLKSNQAKNTDKKNETSANTNAVKEAKEEVTVSKNSRNGKFEIKKSKDGRFVFNLYASNNVIVATSQVYSSSSAAMNGIKSVIANASTAPVEDQTLKDFTSVTYPKWEIYKDKGDQYRFRLSASNGSCVVHSQGYTSKANCKKGIESIIKFASDAEITKVYLDKKDK